MDYEDCEIYIGIWYDPDIQHEIATVTIIDSEGKMLELEHYTEMGRRVAV